MEIYVVLTLVLGLVGWRGEVEGQEAGGRTPLTYRLREEESPSTFIASLPTDGDLITKYPASFSLLEYDFLPSSSVHKDNFDLTGGSLTAIRAIDRDTICPMMADCQFNLDIRAQLLEENIFEILPVIIEIEDINDNTPTFPEDRFERTLPETSLPGTSIRLLPAQDPDGPRYGISRYELLDSSSGGVFDLKVNNNDDGTSDILLVLKEPLDHEMTKSFQMQVIAYDADTPPKTGALTVDIKVKDINDNPPVFTNKTYPVYVFENVPEFTTIARVSAADPDSGPNGEVVYSFSTKTQDTMGDKFGVDEASGEIFIRKVLDYEEGDTYTLDVVASDKNEEPLTAVAKVIVHIRDLNDHAPQITINTMIGDAVEISENAAIGTFVAHITVRDTDGGDNGKFNCSLLDTEYFRLQNIYRTEYKIVTKVVFDREEVSEYEPALRCQDFGNPPQASTQRIKVLIKDENDHQPTFNKTLYTNTLAENNADGAYVMNVMATDADSGANSQVKYTLMGEKAYLFSIDSESGNITARVALDYEALKVEGPTTLELLVVASDLGNPPLSATATARIAVIDEDDVPPQFSKTSYIFGVPENLESDTFVGQVNATDPDSTPSNKFMFSLDTKFNTENAFTIDSNNGRIYTRKMLDREVSGVYHLVVMATSVGAPDQTNTTNIFVSVLDINDNSPIVDFPVPMNNTVYVMDNVTVGRVITRISAKDADSGDNAKLTYNITAGNEKGLFAMNMYTGAVLAAASLKDIQDNDRYFTLFINVHDNGSPVRFFETLLNVVVNKSATDRGETELMSSSNLTIVITIASISGVVMVILVVAIIFIILSQRRNARKKYNNIPRLAEQKMAADKFAKENAVNLDNTRNAAKLNTGSPHKGVGKMNSSFDIKNNDPEKHELHEANIMHMAPSSPYTVNYVHEPSISKPWMYNSALQKNAGLAVYDKGDSDSACSADMSNATDSGHGSNEGDQNTEGGHLPPSSPPPSWENVMRPIQEDGPDRSPAKDPSVPPTRALPPGVHRKSSGNNKPNNTNNRSGHRPPPPRRIPSHQSDSSHLDQSQLILKPDSAYHSNPNLPARGAGNTQWNPTSSGNNLNNQSRDGYYYASHV